VGDLFKAKDDYGQYGDLAQELITWLHSKTYVLALLCELQMSTMGNTLTIIHTVLTRWLSHYLAYQQLLDVWPSLELLITKHEEEIQSTGDARS
jgi:isoprenylcysteine carboxyl methyltransferase (ICMT) family protein YpbQ